MSEAQTHAISTALRPDARALWTRFGQSLIVPGLFIVVNGFRAFTERDREVRVSGAVLFVVLVALVLGSAIITTLRVRNQRIEYSSTELAVTNLWGRRASTARDRVENAVVVTIPPARRRARSVLVVIDTAGRRLVLIDSERWPIGDLWALAGELVTDAQKDSAAPDLAALGRRFPRALPWWIVHPTLQVAIYVLATIAAVAIWFAIMDSVY